MIFGSKSSQFMNYELFDLQNQHNSYKFAASEISRHNLEQIEKTLIKRHYHEQHQTMENIFIIQIH